jgi:sec-independent protein translocase protein TatC
MARSKDNAIDPDDMFADTRMSFGDHLEELRIRLWRALIGFIIAMLLSFLIGKPVLYTFIIRPVESQLQAFHEHRKEKRAQEVLAEAANAKDNTGNLPQVVDLQLPRSVLKSIAAGKEPERVEDPGQLADDQWVSVPARIADPIKFTAATLKAQQLFEPPATMKTFNVTEAFIVYFKICMVCGLVIGSPWIFYQIWSFVAAGLYPQEKKYIHIYLPFSIFLFVTGVLACQFIVMPKAVGALLFFNEWLNLEPDLRLNEWLGFAIWFPVIFGLSFQTPLVMMFLERLGLVTVETLKKKRRIAFFILAAVSAFGPTVDAFSMLFQWVALCLLYELGIWLCVWSPKKTALDMEVPDSEEIIEV